MENNNNDNQPSGGFLDEIKNFNKQLKPTKTEVKQISYVKVIDNDTFIIYPEGIPEEKDTNEENNNSNREKERFMGTIKECHGLLGDKEWTKPYCIVKSKVPNRKDQGNFTDSSEYLDEPEILEKKMEAIANLIKKSKCVIAYTGAGLSRAAGIGDYGSKASNSIVKDVEELRNPLDAKPTFSHHVLSKMEEKGMLKYYVQQNHDGLPQKAGYPQEKINEIHGAWYDPSNPVVMFGGNLRSDLFKWMTKIEEEVDLCICLGTSLSGMNADRCAWTPAKKFSKKKQGNGTIMINLQKTDIDSSCSIRVWSKIDDAFKILAKKLDLDMTVLRSYPVLSEDDIFYIPYDEKGKFLGENSKKLMKLDLTIGSQIKIVHPDSVNYDISGEITNKFKDNYQLKLKPKGKLAGYFALGNWMIDQAIRGKVKQFEFCNLNPEFIDRKK